MRLIATDCSVGDLDARVIGQSDRLRLIATHCATQWAIWVPVQVANLTCVPSRHQLRVVLGASLLWATVLSAAFPPGAQHGAGSPMMARHGAALTVQPTVQPPLEKLTLASHVSSHLWHHPQHRSVGQRADPTATKRHAPASQHTPREGEPGYRGAAGGHRGERGHRARKPARRRTLAVANNKSTTIPALAAPPAPPYSSAVEPLIASR